MKATPTITALQPVSSCKKQFLSRGSDAAIKKKVTARLCADYGSGPDRTGERDCRGVSVFEPRWLTASSSGP